MPSPDKDSNRAAIALVTDSEDNILMGKRNDSGKYTVPAGGIKIGECPYMGMMRELKEETGLDAKNIKLIQCKKAGNTLLYLFKIDVDLDQEIDTSQDPDEECETWEYLDPNTVVNELHHPLDRNLALIYWANN